MGVWWSQAPTDSYYYDAVTSEGHFVIADGISARYTPDNLQVTVAGQAQQYAMRLEQQSFARLHHSLQQGKSLSEAFTVVFRGY